MLMLGFNEKIDYSAMANSVHELRKKDGHVLRMALEFQAEGQKKKGRPKRK